MSDFDSRNEKILESMIDGTEYTDPPQSRIEDLLLQLKEVIEHSSGGHNYSTDEHVVGTWINGKTLYEKTWYFQSSMVAIYRQWTSLNINVLDLDVEEIVNHSAQSYASQSVSIDVWDDNGTLKAQYWQDGLNVGSVTIQYTKTT